MKPPHPRSLHPHWLASVILAAWVAAAGAATLVPTATDDAAVAAAIGARSNFALASGGAVAFSSSDLGPNYSAPDVNDGIIDHTGFSWIPATTATTEYVGVALAAPETVAALVFHGQVGYVGRSGGTWRLQYTTDATVDGASTWTDLGDYIYNDCAGYMPRTLFAFPAIPNVTGARLLLANTACGGQLAVQELELYGPVTAPPAITLQPVGADLVAGNDFVLQVAATDAEAFQWRKDDVDIPGAVGSTLTISDVKTSNAGTYTVLVSSAGGSVLSDPAVLTVSPAPTYASYPEAVLTDNPIHYYPLDETDGTTAADLGSLALDGGTYTNGVTLGQPSADARLGSSARFDGQVGTMVDLGLFHPGDAVTIEAWVRLDSDAPATFSAIVARWDGSYELDFNPSTVANFVVRNDSDTVGIAAGLSPASRNFWHHVVGVFSGGVARVYVDGVKGADASIGGILKDAGPTPDRVMIGATRDGTFNFKGLIDEVAIYDYALTPVQIRAHYRTAFPTEAPAVGIVRAVQLSWPIFPPGYQLQAALEAEGPYQTVTNALTIEDDLYKVTIPGLDEGMMYFQLFKPE